jgi:hypothetical protein
MTGSDMRSSIGNSAGDPVFVQGVGAGGASQPAGTSADPTYTQSAPLAAGTDRSGTAGTSSTTLAAPNNARRSLNIQNISANTLGINEFGGTAAIGSPGTYTVAAGASLNVRTRNAITVIASAASSAYTATEA